MGSVVVRIGIGGSLGLFLLPLRCHSAARHHETKKPSPSCLTR